MGRSRHVPFAGSGLRQALIAVAYAVEQHAGQRRGADGAPFVLHPIEVATMLADVGASDEVVAAGALHDTIEKTSASPEDLRERFGARVTSLVVALTEDPAIPGYVARKAALRDQVQRAGHDALLVFAADKVSKARELRMTFARDAQSGTVRRIAKNQRKLAHYRHCAEMLEIRLSGSPLVESLRHELAELALAERAALAGVS
ncbi:MAG TPA: HD domain-containing protein [Solirubrobacteraceae bacterium]|nr:HD domain-containing protein [Solirubrobacteraceae bacterium]